MEQNLSRDRDHRSVRSGISSCKSLEPAEAAQTTTESRGGLGEPSGSATDGQLHRRPHSSFLHVDKLLVSLDAIPQIYISLKLRFGRDER
jgi:hypothetical protein